MEGRCCALARHGYSRDHRRDRLQIVYGLLCILTINEVALPPGGPRTLRVLARPTALQQQAFALLGVPAPRVQ